MNPTGIALASLLFALPGTAQTAPTASPQPPTTQATPSPKAKAPVTVTTVFSAGKATVTLRFDQAVEQAAIGVRGLDGLQVASLPPAEKTSFAKGEILVLEVACTPGPGRSHLAVDIEGSFRGQHRLAVQTFALGKPSAEQTKAAQSQLLTTSSGQRLRVLPVKQE